MIVVVGADRPPLLAESEDCGRFAVRHVGGDLAAALTSIGGRLDDDGDARVPVAWVRAMSSAPAAAVDEMVAYAGSKAWLDDDGAVIRAHVDPG